jgi:hypothetical protein
VTILSVDLATNRYRDIGVAVLTACGGSVNVEFVEAAASGLRGRPRVQDVSCWLTDLAGRHAADVIFIDGPQGWKDPSNGHVHARACERELATPGKTGLPRFVKPGSWTRMAEFSIDLFDALGDCGFLRVHSTEDLRPGRKLAIESFPTSAWRSLGLTKLPGKSRTSVSQLTSCTAALGNLVPLILARQPSHDELQAVVAGLAGLPLLGHNSIALRLIGLRPVQLEGTWREGFIVNPVMSERTGACS